MLASLCGLAAVSAFAPDELKSVPGWAGALPSKQYSGYLDVGPNGRRHIHYWLVEATGKDPRAKDTPTVLWLNGGPGCSSLDGWYYEQGPFRGSAEDPLTLVHNPDSWTAIANVLFIEAPVGVGFSYSDLPEVDYHVDDDSTSQDNMNAMKEFFKKFPEYKDHPFFLAGESYAGVYVPTLAEAILWEAGNGTWTGAPLSGIAVGNGCSGSETGTCGGEGRKYRGQYFLDAGSFTSPDVKATARAACDWDNITPACDDALDQVFAGLDHINLYDVYGTCLNFLPGDAAALQKAPLASDWRGEGVGSGPTACINSFDATAYFTQALIPNATNVKPIDFKWATCATAEGWSYKSNRANLPRDTYPFLLKHIPVLVYNGDWDSCVPFTDGVAWTKGMDYPVASEWHAWTYELRKQTQVGGYATTYKAPHSFSFVTVKGGRHEVPETAGPKALIMLDRFIKGGSF